MAQRRERPTHARGGQEQASSVVGRCEGNRSGDRWSRGFGGLQSSVDLELLEKLAALVPPPRLNLIRYHGLLAPSARDRPQIVPGMEHEPLPRVRNRPPTLPPSPLLGQTARPRVAIDVTQCLACGGRMRILAALTEPGSIRTYLKGVGMPARPPPIAPARPPAARATSSAQLQTAAISPAPSNPAFRSTPRSCRQRLATRALILPKRTPPLALFKLKRRPRWVPTTPNGFSTYALKVGQEPHVIYHSEQLCLGTALSSDGELAAIGSTDRSGTSSRNLLVFKYAAHRPRIAGRRRRGTSSSERMSERFIGV